MPIEVGFWNITSQVVKKIEYSSITSEKRLEDILIQDISVLNDDLLLIGRQVPTAFGKYIDILAINENGNISIIELKKNRTPRDVIAQVFDYASWVKNLSYDEIKAICEEFHKEEFEKVFAEKFGISPPERINQEHDMVIVCSELDHETERVLNYLSDNYNIPINVAFFRFFSDSGADYISRSWLISPIEVEEKAGRSKLQNKGESWNGRDFIVNIDMFNGKSTWKDCVKYGFISAGGGEWYSKTLKNLFPNARVFAMIPGKGYLGVGKVLDAAVPVKDFNVKIGNQETPIMDITLDCEDIKRNSDDLKLCEYLVRVEWLKTFPEEKAFWEKGLMANQNSAFKLKNKFTLERLKNFFGLNEE